MPAATTGEPSDHVTGLASRGDLQRTLERALAAASAADASKAQGVAVAICDIVGLKGVNESRGFGAGDAALAAAAAAFARAAEGADLVARLGGDELVAVFTGPGAGSAAAATARAAAAVTDPGLRAAAIVAEPGEPIGRLIDRLYATMRKS